MNKLKELLKSLLSSKQSQTESQSVETEQVVESMEEANVEEILVEITSKSGTVYQGKIHGDKVDDYYGDLYVTGQDQFGVLISKSKGLDSGRFILAEEVLHDRLKQPNIVMDVNSGVPKILKTEQIESYSILGKQVYILQRKVLKLVPTEGV